MADDQLQKRDGNILINSALYGVVSVPTILSVLDDITTSQRKIAIYLFAAAVLGSAVSTFLGSNIRSRSLIRSTQDGLWAALCFFLGGFIPLTLGNSIPGRLERNLCLVVLTASLLAFIFMINFFRKKDDQQQPERRTYWILVLFTVLAIAAIVAFADQANHLRSEECKKQCKT